MPRTIQVPLYLVREGLVHARLLNYSSQGLGGAEFWTACGFKFYERQLAEAAACGPVTCLTCLAKGQKVGEMPT